MKYPEILRIKQQLPKIFEDRDFSPQIERIVGEALPLKKIMEGDPDTIFDRILETMPLVHIVYSEDAIPSTHFSFIVPLDQCKGLGRYVTEICSRWVLPGQVLPVTTAFSYNFIFVNFPNRVFFVKELTVEAPGEKTIKNIAHNSPIVGKEIRTNLIAVDQTRTIVKIPDLTFDERVELLKERLGQVIEEFPSEVGAHVHKLLQDSMSAAIGEVRVDEIRAGIARIMEMSNPNDHTLFKETKRHLLLFAEKFVYARAPKHIIRILCYFHLFRKTLLQEHEESPDDQHFALRTFQVVLPDPDHRSVMAICIGHNLLPTNIPLEEERLAEIIRIWLPNAVKVEESYYEHRRLGERFKLMYIEVCKNNGQPFTDLEMWTLRKMLPAEIKERLFYHHKIRWHRNEEDAFKNIVHLARQLRTVNDPPQVSVNYFKSDRNNLIFTVLLVRVVKSEHRSIRELLEEHREDFVRLEKVDVHKVGLIRKKHTKEAIIFDIAMDAKKYSTELSSDVYRARQGVIELLIKIFGEVRDSNGTLVAKQVDALSRVKKLFDEEDVPTHFLFEPFFYSLNPTYMQTVLPPAVIKTFFKFFHSVVRSNSSEAIPMVRKEIHHSYYMTIVAAPKENIRDFIIPPIEKLKLEGDLVSTAHNFTLFQVLSFMIRIDGKSEKILESKVREAFKEWRAHNKSPKKKLTRSANLMEDYEESELEV
ncbi:MAG: hypothetical protein SNF33_02090 [Candidatus Algichlamydia australiensis]|nr:hypothetical protein [Chlamydiales bacterium]